MLYYLTLKQYGKWILYYLLGAFTAIWFIGLAEILLVYVLTLNISLQVCYIILGIGATFGGILSLGHFAREEGWDDHSIAFHHKSYLYSQLKVEGEDE